VSTVPRFPRAGQTVRPGFSWTAEDGSARSVVEVVRDHLEEIRDETGYSVPAGVADEIASLVERLR
jgi:DNA-binding IclR family transcriptional regulator